MSTDDELLLEAPDEAATKAIAAALAGLLEPGDVVWLTGDLGAGKTRFVQGAAAALEVGEPVVSPTFMLVRVYDGHVPVYHVDAYRLRGPAELEDLGLEEVLPAVNHQPEFAAHCVMPAADQALYDGAVALAWTAIDAATDEALRTRLLTQAG